MKRFTPGAFFCIGGIIVAIRTVAIAIGSFSDITRAPDDRYHFA